jgi:K+-transporting ATPase ATPase C chain
MKQLLIAVKATIVLTILTGLIYPLVVTGLAKVLFPHQAQGSLIEANGKVIGSELIGQRFTKVEYFHGRPSGAGNDGYDGLSSGGFNQGPTNKKLIDRVHDDVAKFRADNPTFTGTIPADIVTGSGSGLDPHISPAAAEAQAARVASARNMPIDTVRRLIASQTEDRQLVVLGEPRVNVLLLNLALDRAAPMRR